MSAQLKSPMLAIRPMQQEDLQQVLAIEELSYDFPWTLGIFVDCLRVGYCCWVITLDEAVIGYGVMSVAANECHILNVCIHPQQQGHGLGGQLFRRLLQLGKLHGAKTAFLEVRASNHHALRLYEQLGFLEVGRRKDYYPSKQGREDALVMSQAL